MRVPAIVARGLLRVAHVPQCLLEPRSVPGRRHVRVLAQFQHPRYYPARPRVPPWRVISHVCTVSPPAGVPCTDRTCPASAVEYDDATNCELPQCPGEGGVSCSGHGTCTLSEQCVCSDGWHGDGCELAPCPFSCRQHGTCGADSMCTCDTFVVEPVLQEYRCVRCNCCVLLLCAD